MVVADNVRPCREAYYRDPGTPAEELGPDCPSKIGRLISRRQS